MIFNYNEIFAPDLISGLEKMNTSFNKIAESVNKMATTIEISYEKTGKAYLKNKQAIDRLLKATELQLKLDKEKSKLDKETQKIINNKIKAEQKEKVATENLVKTEKKLVKAIIELNKSKKEGKNIEQGYTKVIETQKNIIANTVIAHGKLSNEYAKEKAKLKEIQTEQKGFNQQQKQVKKFTDVADGSLAKMTLELGKLKTQYRNASEAGRNKLTPSIRKLDAEVKKLNADIGNFQGNVGNYKSAFSKLSGVAGGLGLSLGGAALAMKGMQIAKDVGETLRNFEKTMSEVKAISGASGEEFETLTNLAKDLGRQTTFSASQVAELEIELSKLGFSAQDIDEVTESVLYLAQATGSDLATTANVAGATLRGFGLDASQMGHVTDVMALSFSSSALDMEKFNTAMSTVAPVARTFGFSLEDTTSLLAQLTNAGFDASTAGTSLRNIMLNMADPAGDLATALGEPVTDLPSLVAGFEKLKSEGIDLAGALDLTDKRSVAAFEQFLATGEQALVLSDNLANADGSAMQMAETMTNNLDGAMKGLSSAWEGLILGVEMGDGKMGSSIVTIINLISEVMNLATDANFLGKQFNTLLTPLFDIFDIFTGLGNILSVFSKETEEGTDSIQGLTKIMDILVFTFKISLAPLTTVIKILKFLFEIVEKGIVGNKDKIKKFGIIFERMGLIFSQLGDIIKKLYNDNIKPLIDSLNKGGDSVDMLGVALDGLFWYLDTVTTGFQKMLTALHVLKVENDAVINSFSSLEAVMPSIAAVMGNAFDEEAYKAELAASSIITANNNVIESEDDVTENLRNNADERQKIRDKLNLTTAREYYYRELAELENYLENAYISEEEFLELKKQMYIDYFGEGEELQTTHINLIEDNQVQLNENLLDLQRRLGEQTIAEQKRSFSDYLDLILGDREKLKNSLKDFYETAIDETGKYLKAQLDAAKEQQSISNKNINNIKNELETELKTQELRQKSGEAYDLIKIENLKKNLEKEQQIEAENAEKIAKTQKKLIYFQLGIDTASSISSLIAASEGNPMNLLTSGAAGILQLTIGLARIFGGFATARAQIKGFKSGIIGIDGDGTETSDSIPAFLSKGESVMTAKETRENLGALKLMRAGFSVDNLILNKDNELDRRRNEYLKQMTKKTKQNLYHRTLN